MASNGTPKKPRLRWPLRQGANQALLVCVGLGLVLCGWIYHRSEAPRTTLAFEVRMDGQTITEPSGYTATLEDKRVKSGSVVGMGWHELEVAMPDAPTMRTNVFVWYGTNNLGQLDLARNRGEIRLTVEPLAKAVFLRGPYGQVSLTNTPGMTGSVPVGKYEGRVVFDHFEEPIELRVASHEVCTYAMQPLVSRLRLTSEPSEARFQLTGIDRTNVDLSGVAPSVVGPLATGNYHLRMWRGDYVKETNLGLIQGMTHRMAMVFEYGEIALTSKPTGALVYAEGAFVGRTPMKIRDLRPGRYDFTLKRPGFHPCEMGADVRGSGVVSLATNLLSVRYTEAMDRARVALAAEIPAYAMALARVEEALEERPGDAEATALKRECEAVLKAESNRAAEKKKAEEIEARQHHPDELFHRLTDRRRYADLFDTQSIHVEGSVGHARAAVRQVLAAEPPWEVLLDIKTDADTCLIEARFMSLTQGKRTIVVVAGQVSDDAVDIFYKIWDYALGPHLGARQIDGVREENLLPVHPDYLRDENQKAIEERRKKVVEEFKIKLLRELSAVRPPW